LLNTSIKKLRRPAVCEHLNKGGNYVFLESEQNLSSFFDFMSLALREQIEVR
jgi:hypothetical protein